MNYAQRIVFCLLKPFTTFQFYLYSLGELLYFVNMLVTSMMVLVSTVIDVQLSSTWRTVQLQNYNEIRLKTLIRRSSGASIELHPCRRTFPDDWIQIFSLSVESSWIFLWCRGIFVRHYFADYFDKLIVRSILSVSFITFFFQ